VKSVISEVPELGDTLKDPEVGAELTSRVRGELITPRYDYKPSL